MTSASHNRAAPDTSRIDLARQRQRPRTRDEDTADDSRRDSDAREAGGARRVVFFFGEGHPAQATGARRTA